MTTKTFIQRFQAEVAAMVDLIKRKNSDYADSSEELTKEALIARFNKNDPFRNFGLVEHLGIADMESGILVRMCDKISRIATLHAKAKRGEDRRVTDESIKDTLRDLANYAIILVVAMDRTTDQSDAQTGVGGLMDDPRFQESLRQARDGEAVPFRDVMKSIMDDIGNKPGGGWSALINDVMREGGSLVIENGQVVSVNGNPAKQVGNRVYVSHGDMPGEAFIDGPGNPNGTQVPVCPNCGQSDCIGAMPRQHFAMSPELIEALSLRVPVGAGASLEGETLGDVISRFTGPFDVSVATFAPETAPEDWLGRVEPYRFAEVAPLQAIERPDFHQMMILSLIEREDIMNFKGGHDLIEQACKIGRARIGEVVPDTPPSTEEPPKDLTYSDKPRYTPFDLKPGDLVVLGKRQWRYECRTQDYFEWDEPTQGSEQKVYPLKHHQNEWLFKPVQPEFSGALGQYRVFSQSELQALINAGGFVFPAGILEETKVVDREEVKPPDAQ